MECAAAAEAVNRAIDSMTGELYNFSYRFNVYSVQMWGLEEHMRKCAYLVSVIADQ